MAIKKKQKKDKQQEKEMTIIDHAYHEKKMVRSTYANNQEGKKYTHKLFDMWVTLPDQFKGMPERLTLLLGITDEVTLEVLKLTSMKAFAEEFGVIPQTLSRWRRELEHSDDYLPQVKDHMKKLTKNLMAALYRKAMEEGDAPRFTAWMKIIEGWREQLGVETDIRVHNLSDEERKKLDELISKNTK